MTRKDAERQEAIDNLRKWLKPGDTVFCVLRSRSRSGMSRVIQLVKFEQRNGELQDVYLGWNAARALGWRYDQEREGIRVGGCGMDMGFHTVYELAATLWPDEKRAGYLLKHRWL